MTQRPYRALLVEDNRADVEFLRSLLDDLDELTLCEVAHTLEDGIRLCRQEDAEIVLLDLHLPDSDHDQTVASIGEFQSRPVVIVTKERSTDAMYTAGYNGAVGYVLKPQFLLEVADQEARDVGVGIYREQLLHTIFCAIGHARKRREIKTRARRAIEQIERS